jgi:hypothetical protein
MRVTHVAKSDTILEKTLVKVSFEEWLKRQRKSAGLTQEQLAQQLIDSTSRKLRGYPKTGVRVYTRTPVFGLLPFVS